MKRFVSLLLPFVFFGDLVPAAVSLVEDGPEGITLGQEPSKAAVQALVDSYNKGRYIEAYRLAMPLASEGEPAAFLIMGLSHETGRGAEKSRDLAIKYYRKLHNAGGKEGSFRLATALIAQGSAEEQVEAQMILEKLALEDKSEASMLLGEGSLKGWFGNESDFEKAREYWAKAAENGDAAIIMTYARLLDGKFGFPEKRDAAAALKQYERAAEKGDAVAMVAAGSRLLNGDDALRDEKRGRELLSKAVEKGQLDAHLAIGDFEEVVKRDDKLALDQYKLGAVGGNASCMLKLATFIEAGRGGVEKDAAAALDWLRKAGAAGDPLGHVRCAAILLKGEGLQIVEGYTHLVAAAEAGFADIQNEVGLLYLSGRLGVRDATAAAGWFGRAADAGYPQGAHNLGSLYEQGLGVGKNLSAAAQLYLRAVKAGHPQSTTAIARLMAQGDGVKQDLAQAWALYSIAIERGDESAKPLLGQLTSELDAEQLAQGREALERIKAPPEGEKKNE